MARGRAAHVLKAGMKAYLGVRKRVIGATGGTADRWETLRERVRRERPNEGAESTATTPVTEAQTASNGATTALADAKPAPTGATSTETPAAKPAATPAKPAAAKPRAARSRSDRSAAAKAGAAAAEAGATAAKPVAKAASAAEEAASSATRAASSAVTSAASAVESTTPTGPTKTARETATPDKPASESKPVEPRGEGPTDTAAAPSTAKTEMPLKPDDRAESKPSTTPTPAPELS